MKLPKFPFELNIENNGKKESAASFESIELSSNTDFENDYIPSTMTAGFQD